MAGYLVDTDVLVDFLRQRAPAVAFLRELAPEDSYVSVVSYAELYEGVARSRRPVEEQVRVERLTATANILGVDLDTARTFGQLRAELRSRGRMIADFDLLIAATAIRNDLTLVSRNERDFGRIDRLRLRVLRDT